MQHELWIQQELGRRPTASKSCLLMAAEREIATVRICSVFVQLQLLMGPLQIPLISD
jgi:hypothetical protein